jgi:PPM family protein phosphatase
MQGIVSVGKTDVGLRRTNNEDSFVVRPGLTFVSVADGMGGAASGEVASRIFSETAIEIFSRNKTRSEEEMFNVVQTAFRAANDRIFETAQKNPEYRGMGCTAELLAFHNLRYVLGHVGDSRTYLFRQGQLRQMTKDHSLVQGQLDQGLITPDEALRHAHRNVILRAIGVDQVLEVDLLKGICMTGDIFLLCSDGLTDMVEDSVVMGTLSLDIDIGRKAEQLIDAAKSAGGNDNVTVVLCEVLS